jgi:type I restriction enzyme, S subunit
MKRWPFVRLGDVAEIKSGAGFPLDKQGLRDQSIPFFKVGDMNTPGNESEMHIFRHSISEETRDQLGAALLPTGTVVFPKVGAAIGTNKKRILVRPSCVDNNIMGIFPCEKLAHGFLFSLLVAKNLTEFASNANPPSIRKTTVEDWRIPVPPLAEQRSIVRLLNEVSGLQRLRAQADRTTASLIPALYNDMFGDPVTNPFRWPVMKAGKLMETCEYGTSEKANDANKGITVLRMGNVTIDGILDLEDLKTVELEDNQLAKQRLRSGDVLFNRTNSRELVGKTAMWDGRFEAVAASYFIRVRFRSDAEDPQHFTTFMNLPLMKQRLAQMARGAVGQANINATELQSIELPVPPLRLQEEFAQRVIEIRALESEQDASRRRLDDLFQSMLHRAFNGEL